MAVATMSPAVLIVNSNRLSPGIRGGERVASLVDRLALTGTNELWEATSAVDAEATRLCWGMSEEQLSWQPRPRSWSIAENLAHLRATTEVFLPAVDATLTAIRKLSLQSKGSCQLGLYGRLLVWTMECRPVIKMKAPKPIQPRLLDSPASELQHFLGSQAAIRQRIADADGLDLTAFRFPSPLVNCFRVNLLEFFSTLNAHSRRHLRQADKVRRKML
jgi:DinB superfamily